MKKAFRAIALALIFTASIASHGNSAVNADNENINTKASETENIQLAAKWST